MVTLNIYLNFLLCLKPVSGLHVCVRTIVMTSVDITLLCQHTVIVFEGKKCIYNKIKHRMFYLPV